MVSSFLLGRMLALLAGFEFSDLLDCFLLVPDLFCSSAHQSLSLGEKICTVSRSMMSLRLRIGRDPYSVELATAYSLIHP